MDVISVSYAFQTTIHCNSSWLHLFSSPFNSLSSSMYFSVCNTDLSYSKYNILLYTSIRNIFWKASANRSFSVGPYRLVSFFKSSTVIEPIEAIERKYVWNYFQMKVIPNIHITFDISLFLTSDSKNLKFSNTKAQIRLRPLSLNIQIKVWNWLSLLSFFFYFGKSFSILACIATNIFTGIGIIFKLKYNPKFQTKILNFFHHWFECNNLIC